MQGFPGGFPFIQLNKLWEEEQTLVSTARMKMLPSNGEVNWLNKERRIPKTQANDQRDSPPASQSLEE
jgi:hypothetical protein